MPGAILEPDAADAALSLELHPWPPDCSVAQSLSAMAHRDLHRRQNDPDRIPGILGILVDGAKQPVAIPEVDRRWIATSIPGRRTPSLINLSPYKFVILSEAKDLLSLALTRKQILRFARDDNPQKVLLVHPSRPRPDHSPSITTLTSLPLPAPSSW